MLTFDPPSSIPQQIPLLKTDFVRQIPCSPKRTRRLAVNDSIVDQRYLKEEHFMLESQSIITYGNLRYDDSSLACFRHSDRDVWREATVFPVHHPCLRHPHNLKAWNRRFPAIYVCARGVGEVRGLGGERVFGVPTESLASQFFQVFKFSSFGFTLKINPLTASRNSA